MPPKKISVKKRPLAKRYPRRGLGKGGPLKKGQRKALDALFKTYPINGNEADD
jgi:hypothetical protein